MAMTSCSTATALGAERCFRWCGTNGADGPFVGAQSTAPLHDGRAAIERHLGGADPEAGGGAFRAGVLHVVTLSFRRLAQWVPARYFVLSAVGFSADKNFAIVGDEKDCDL